MNELPLALIGVAGLAVAAAATAGVVASRRRDAERRAASQRRARPLDEDPIIAALGLDEANRRDRRRDS